MSNKAICPGCDTYTSAIYDVMYRGEGNECPYCALPREAMLLVKKARDNKIGLDLIDEVVESTTRANLAEKERDAAVRKLNEIRGILGCL